MDDQTRRRGFDDALSVDRIAAGTADTINAAAPASIVWGGHTGDDVTLQRLYLRATATPWQIDDLPWGRPEPEPADRFSIQRDLSRVHRMSPFAKFSDDNWAEFDWRSLQYFVSQLVYGEQMAVVAAGETVAMAPSWDAKLFAAVQAADEARHVATFERYASELGELFAMNGQLRSLLADALSSGRWEMLYVANQVIIEGMALGSFDLLAKNSNDPLLLQMLRYVIADEARHVAFGVSELKQVIAGSDAVANHELAEFAFESALALRTRMVAVPVLEEMGIDVRSQLRVLHRSAEHRRFEAQLFCHVRRIAERSGLAELDNSWLDKSFDAAGIAVSA